jgi:hypothetical protein
MPGLLNADSVAVLVPGSLSKGGQPKKRAKGKADLHGAIHPSRLRAELGPSLQVRTNHCEELEADLQGTLKTSFHARPLQVSFEPFLDKPFFG